MCQRKVKLLSVMRQRNEKKCKTADKVPCTKILTIGHASNTKFYKTKRKEEKYLLF